MEQVLHQQESICRWTDLFFIAVYRDWKPNRWIQRNISQFLHDKWHCCKQFYMYLAHM